MIAKPTTPSAALQTSPAPRETGLEQRLLAEAVRLHEDAQGFAIADPQADAAARQAGGDFERRLLVRAQALTVAPALLTALHQLRNAFGLIVAVGLVLALVGGATAARVALGTDFDRPFVNFFWLLGSLLGVPTVTLLSWLVVLFTQPGAMASSSLGGLAFLLGRRLDRWLHRGPIHIAAVQALASVYTRTSIGRWTLSAVSHALWLAFLTGCLVLVILILSTKQYNFAWETTILSDEAYIGLTRAIASLPEGLGFTTPSAEQIIASHWTGGEDSPGGYREAWSGLLVGSIVVYGLLPRALLLVVCLVARRRAIRRFHLDTALPGYARLQSRLLPAARAIGVVDPDVQPVHPPAPVPVQVEPRSIQATGPAAILGLEIDRPAAAWPPPVDGVEWLDLGFIDSRDDRHRALEQVRSPPLPLRAVAVVCSVATTPDRGTRGFIGDLCRAASAPLVIVLTDGQRLRERGHPDEVEQRFADWRALAEGARVPAERVLDVDLSHLTDASRARLATLLGAGHVDGVPARRIEQAFSLILEQVRGWPEEPDASAQAELHRAIARLYSHARRDGQLWQALLQTPVKTGGDLLGQLKSGANRMVELLPDRLRKNPRWYAAGAAAGALGCVAAATLIAPAAIASLPMWAGLGAALAAVIPRKTAPAAVEKPARDFADAVNGAALFAILLELQGRDEVTITRIIDRVAGEGEPPAIGDAEAARRWLDTLRHRFDLAQAAER